MNWTRLKQEICPDIRIRCSWYASVNKRAYVNHEPRSGQERSRESILTKRRACEDSVGRLMGKRKTDEIVFGREEESGETDAGLARSIV